MRQPRTREISWLMMTGNSQDEVFFCLETEGKQRRYLINGNQFRDQLNCLKKSGFNIKKGKEQTK